MSYRFEQVESELLASLLPCPECGSQPTIYRRTDPWRYEVGTFIACENCVKEWCCGRDDLKKRTIAYPYDADWKPSLYEAVAMWQMNAALLGPRKVTPQEGQLYVDMAAGPDESNLSIWHDGRWEKVD